MICYSESEKAIMTSTDVQNLRPWLVEVELLVVLKFLLPQARVPQPDRHLL